MTFATWQREYAARGLPTFPVRIVDQDKRPAVRNYLRVGLSASIELGHKFRDATAFGFALGTRSKITVLDVDTNDEGVLADALTRHGETPVVVRSGGGNFQAWYRHSGERRHIRPNREVPIDVLGAGFVVAPPSHGRMAPYEIIRGSLDDLDSLPALRNFVPEANVLRAVASVIPIGQRNDALFRHCMRQARACDEFESLHDVALTFAAQCEQAPGAVLAPEEIHSVALSAWRYTQRGQNWVGADHIAFDRSTFPPSRLLSDPYLYALLCWLRDHDAPGRSIMVADALADLLGWSKHQLRETRRRAVGGDWLRLLEPPTRSRAARFCWGPTAGGYGLRNPEAISYAGREGEGGSVR